ncbi:MAG: ABC-F family ATP-binding cassette domain-containing protein [Paludibacteraceae bacterium]|nr:ABC-F family ATP-binding cassette domain-containing protein [Paludibacteraceae bacterium]
MLSIDHISIEFSSHPVLDDISFLVNKKDRIALVGKNGAGKTTLLRLIAGEYEPTSGHITKDRDLTIGYLPQVMFLQDGRTLKEEVMTIFNGDDEARFVAEMDKTIIGLGFERNDFDRPTTEFSGGWRMRIELAKILLRHPDLILLDEPTNHLDIESIQWLENFLAQSQSAVLLVSHDRAFLDHATTRTIEITLGHIYDYNVPYSQFVTLRQERHEQQVRAFQNQQKMIQDTEEFIERFRYKATKAIQVQSRIKQLERLERLEVDLEDTSRLNLKFPPAPRSGDFPLIIEGLEKSFPSHTSGTSNKVIISDVNLTIRRGEKVAFVGKNGEGKTTLVRCIMGQIDHLGTLKIGHNVKIGYFAQNQAALLDENKTVFQTIDDVAVGDIRTKIRDILGAFMFGGEASDKKVKVLSGGERSRLAMIRLLLEPCNLLILDEPTNHLDMASKDVLKAALQEFNGTVICVSHDRDFLDGLVSKVYEFGGGRVREHLGGIYDFLQSKKMEDLSLLNSRDNRRSTDGQPTVNRQSKPISGALDYAAQKAVAAEKRKKEKQIADIETAITALEQQQAEIEALLALPENQTQENFHQYETIKHQIEQKLYEWEILSE